MPCTHEQEAGIRSALEAVCLLYPPAKVDDLTDHSFARGCRFQVRNVSAAALPEFPESVNSALFRCGFQMTGFTSFSKPGGESILFDIAIP